MDFILRLKDYVTNNVTLTAPIEPGLLNSDSQSIALRETPGNIPDRYWDKGKIHEYNFQFLVKDPSYMGASNQCHAIAEALDGLPPGSILSQDGSFSFITCEVYTTPNYVDKNDHGEIIFTALFAAQLEKGGS